MALESFLKLFYYGGSVNDAIFWASDIIRQDQSWTCFDWVLGKMISRDSSLH